MRAAAEIGFPVALKTAQPGTAHKSDAGGVRLDLRDSAVVAAAYDDMARRLGPAVLIQAMVDKAVEVALGAINDSMFGPYVMVAAGGIRIELLDDRSVALAPVSRTKAGSMIERLKLRKLLAGLRGAPPADVQALVDALWRLSHLAYDLRDSLREVDINPIIVGSSGAVAVDALIIGNTNRHAG